MHRRAKPEAFTKASLQRLLGLQDRLAVTQARLAHACSPRTSLFELETGGAQGARARRWTTTQLDSLSRYLTGLDKASAQRVLRAVAQTPARMAELGKPRVREAIIASSDQAAAVGMMLQATSLPDPTLMLEHLEAGARRPREPAGCCGRSTRSRWSGRALLALILLLLMRAAAVRHAAQDRRAARLGDSRPRPRRPLMRLVTAETIPDRPIEQGEMVYACAVSGANILRDMREAVINTIGGHMTEVRGAAGPDHRARARRCCRSAPGSRATTACSASASRTPPSPAAPSRWSSPALGFRYQGTEIRNQESGALMP